MNIILITTLVIAAIGIVVSAGLVFTGKKFAVQVDEKEVAVREKLPGHNCGACGFAGCDALAAAIAKGEAPVNACPVGGAPVAQEIGDIMGTTAGALERKVARLHTPVAERKVGTPDLPESYVRHLTDELRKMLGCAVRVTSGVTHANGKHTKGVLEIDFLDNDDLDRVLSMIGVKLD